MSTRWEQNNFVVLSDVSWSEAEEIFPEVSAEWDVTRCEDQVTLYILYGHPGFDRPFIIAKTARCQDHELLCGVRVTEPSPLAITACHVDDKDCTCWLYGVERAPRSWILRLAKGPWSDLVPSAPPSTPG